MYTRVPVLVSARAKGDSDLQLEWEDGHSGSVSLNALRDACPCATCQGETVLLHRRDPVAPAVDTPGRYGLTGAQTVGNYAIQFFWGDGHSEGIYAWDYLRSLCECDQCRAARRAGGP